MTDAFFDFSECRPEFAIVIVLAVIGAVAFIALFASSDVPPPKTVFLTEEDCA